MPNFVATKDGLIILTLNEIEYDSKLDGEVILLHVDTGDIGQDQLLVRNPNYERYVCVRPDGGPSIAVQPPSTINALPVI